MDYITNKINQVQKQKSDKMCTIPSPTSKSEKAALPDGSETADSKETNGGADGARTRDLQRDRAKFFVPDLA
jgi:hypothetical protein